MIHFILPLPLSINATYKTGSGNFYKSKEAKDWEEEAGWVIKKSYRGNPVGSPVYVGIEFFFKTKRDIDGGIKIVLDLLQRQGILVNDSLIEHLNIKKYLDKDNPRCEVCIEKL